MTWVVGVALLLVRLALGATLTTHGAHRLSGWGLFPKPGDDGRAPQAPTRTPLAALGELAAGVLFLLGLLTPVAAAVVIGIATVEAWRRRGQRRAVLDWGDHERLLLLLAGPVAVGLAFTGPGILSVDHPIGLAGGGVVPGLVALTLGLVGATAAIGGRDRLEDPLGDMAEDD